jgi:hypothetical protein
MSGHTSVYRLPTPATVRGGRVSGCSLVRLAPCVHCGRGPAASSGFQQQSASTLLRVNVLRSDNCKILILTAAQAVSTLPELRSTHVDSIKPQGLTHLTRSETVCQKPCYRLPSSQQWLLVTLLLLTPVTCSPPAGLLPPLETPAYQPASLGPTCLPHAPHVNPNLLQYQHHRVALS